MQQYQTQSDDNTFAQARAELERRIANNEGPAGLLPLSLAQISYLQNDHAGVVGFARSAVYECLLEGQIACELQARRFLNFSLDALGDYPGAVKESEKTYELSRLLSLPADQVKAASALARDRLFSLSNIPRALQVLDQSAHLVANVDIVSQLYFDYWRGRAAQRLGHTSKALLAFRKVASRASGTTVEDLGLASHIEALGIEVQIATSTRQRQQFIDQLEHILKDVNTPEQVRIRAEMVRHQQTPGIDAQRDLTHCAETARELENPEIATRCETQLAMLLAPTDVAGAQRWLATASAEIAKNPTPEMTLLLARAELRTLWNLPVSTDTISESLDLLKVIETGRNLQRVGDRSTELLGFLNNDHYWLADQLMAAVNSEQLPAHHARDALKVLSAARASRAGNEHYAEASRIAIRNWVAWRGNDGNLPKTLTRSQFDLQEALDNTSQTLLAGPSVKLPLDQLEKQVETLVFFQWHHNPAFVRRAFIVQWPNVSSVVLDPDRQADQLLMSLENGVFSADEKQIEQALAGLATSITEPLENALLSVDEPLILLPDGSLHGIPLGALPGAKEQIVDARIYPSLNSWAAERRDNSTPKSSSAVLPSLKIFAAPALPTAVLPGTNLSANPLPLPAARLEAKEIHRRWPDSQILLGPGATESAAVSALTSAASWVHFAAHAKIQTSQPLFSSLQLAADETNDGWLTVKEIATLKIPGNVVVLSACESASGRRLSGEGLVGMTTALVDSGASAVLANLWPVDDALAAQFIGRWYARLAGGASLSSALAQTRTDFSEAGYPASSWAGWTLLGGTLSSPLERPATAGWFSWQLVIFALLAFIILGLTLSTLASRNKPTHNPTPRSVR